MNTMITKSQNTSKKYLTFLSGPVGDKDVSCLPGIGRVGAAHLKKAEIEKASVVLGRYMDLEMNEVNFKDWLRHTAVTNERNTNLCFLACQEYAQRYNLD